MNINNVTSKLTAQEAGVGSIGPLLKEIKRVWQGETLQIERAPRKNRDTLSNRGHGMKLHPLLTSGNLVKQLLVSRLIE